MEGGEMKEKRIKLSKERKKRMTDQIRRFFMQERDEDIGDLAANLILDFIMDKIAPDFYNQGLEDANLYISDKLEDMYGLQI